MKFLACLCILAVAVHATSVFAGEEEEDEEEPAAISYGGDLAFDLNHAGKDDQWLVNVDAGAWMEADLGSLIGADDWYLFINPTLVWGAEEDWKWRPRLYQAWLKWDGSDTFNALVGMVDLSWHFHSLPSASPFVRLPARSSGEFSPGSIGLLDLFPLSSPTLRLEWQPTSHFYLQSAASWLDDDHQIKGRELLLGLPASQRWVLIGELGYKDESDEEHGWRHRLYGAGGWSLPGADSWGVYAFADAKLWGEGGQSSEGLSGFMSLSTAKAAGFEQEHRLVSGLSYEGLLPQRHEDVTALALIIEHQGAADQEQLKHPQRTALELLHRLRLSEHLWVQASIQWQGNLEDSGQGEWRTGLRIGWEF
jgi:carbohydrate-selective porin OprB